MRSNNISIVEAVVVLIAAAWTCMLSITSGAPAPVPAKILTNDDRPAATIAVISVTKADTTNVAGAADATSNARIIKWQSANFPADAGVSVNLLRKLSDSPARYDLVRSLATDIENTGQLSWTPAENEMGEDNADLYIEVVCAEPGPYACITDAQPIKAF